MQQCDSKYVVKYYGSYFKNCDLWVSFPLPVKIFKKIQIVMEYCGAGSVSDIMRLRRKTLTEAEISAVLRDTLKGLRYLHDLKKIHRDIKAGNILLNMEGHAKLADFGVAGQLTVCWRIKSKNETMPRGIEPRFRFCKARPLPLHRGNNFFAAAI